MTEPTPEPTPGPQPTDGGAQSGWTPPASQQELNRIIAERVNRERAKFADYEDLKAQAARIPELEEKATQAESVIADVPNKVAAELRTHLIGIHGIETDDAELFLTASEPSLLVKQVERLISRGSSTPGTPRPDPSQGATGTPLPLNGDPIEKALRQKLGIA